MAQKVDFEPKELLDSCGYNNMKGISRLLREDKDFVMLIVGRERVGKSTLAMILASIVDETFNIDRCVFPTIELKKVLHYAKQYQAVVQDEGAETWLSTETNKADSREMTRVLMEIGFKNLFLAILIPDVVMAQRYLKGHRAKALVRVVARGRYQFYHGGQMRDIRFDKQNRRVMWGKPTFSGYYKPIPKQTTFWQKYLVKKSSHIGHKAENPKVMETRLKMEKILRGTLTNRQAAEMLQVNVNSFSADAVSGKIKKRYGIKSIKVGGQRRWFIKDIQKACRIRLGGNLDTIHDRATREEVG